MDNGLLLRTLRLISEGGPDADEWEAKLRLHRPINSTVAEALVWLYKNWFVAELVNKRIAELKIGHLANVMPGGSHGKVGMYVSALTRRAYSEFFCELRRSQGLLAALLVAPNEAAAMDAFEAARISEHEYGYARFGVYLVRDTVSSRHWFGNDASGPQPGELWTVVESYPVTTAVRRAPDMRVCSVFGNMLHDQNFTERLGIEEP